MTSDSTADLMALDAGFQAWLDERADALAHFKVEPPDFAGKLALLRALQCELFDAGWALHGWPEALGGRGGSVLHRAVLIEALERNGFPPRHVFEHLDILPPALVRFGQPALVEALFLPTLRGDVLWCQGFSEPAAGSDLAALRTRADRVDGGYRIAGHKIWTSWAPFATHCMFLARTGSPEDRHRGLTAFVIDTSAEGLEIGAIKQSNGSDELAEVFFDGAFVPEAQRVGDEGEGWSVAMHILAGERGSFAWLRNSELLAALERLAGSVGAQAAPEPLGESLTRIVALRCRSREVMETLAAGREPGPESSVTKVLAVDAEQRFYEAAREALAPGVELGTAPEVDFWQEHYLYSRASSVYGGARQIQLNVIAKLLVQREGEAPASDDAAEVAALRTNVAGAIEKSGSGREALAGLDWWSFAVAPSEPFGAAAFAAWFEAQGAALVASPALAGVRCAHAAEVLGVAPDRLAFAVDARGDDLLVLGLDAETRWLVAERDGALVALPGDGLVDAPSRALDPGLVRGVRVESGDPRALAIDPERDARARDLARVAIACEILGAARHLLRLSVAHVNQREQFGQPLAGFQAIQHLLSESQVELSALDALCRAAVEEWAAGGARELAAVAKARAGSDGRSIAQRALQCFGAIGFTDEHAHHRYSRRIHTLDAVLGSATALRRALGSELLETGRAPRCIQVWHPAGDDA